MSRPTAYRRPLPPLLPVAAAVFSLSLLILAFLAGDWGVAEVAAEQHSCDGQKVCNPTVKSTSRSPAAQTGYEVSFTTPTDKGPISPTDSIIMVLHEDIRVPPAIVPFNVRVRYSGGTGEFPPDGLGIASAVDLENQNDPRRSTTVTIYPAVMKNGAPVPIPPGATVTITFPKSTGIANPTEGGAFSWTVATSKSPTAVQAQHPDQEVLDAFRRVELDAGHGGKGDEGLLVDWEIQLTSETVSRGAAVTAIGRGYKNGTTLTFWRDADFDGVRDDNEAQLCQTDVAANDIGHCTFTVSKPPFAGVYGECDIRNLKSETDEADHWIAGDDANCNFINAVDGQNHTSILVIDEEMAGDGNVEHADQVLELEGHLAAEVGPSRRLTVQMQDFPPGDIKNLDLAGLPIIDTDSDPAINRTNLNATAVPANGSLYFTADLPAETRRGYQSLRVVVSHREQGHNEAELHEVRITIWVEPDAIVRVFPEKVVPNQRIRLEGRGFIVPDSGGAGEIAQINFGGHPIDLASVNGGEGPAPIDSSGSWFGYVDLPIVAATTTPGTREVRITDKEGRGGSVEVTIPPRELTVAPIWSRPGTIITVSGSGFPSRNDSGSGCQPAHLLRVLGRLHRRLRRTRRRGQLRPGNPGSPPNSRAFIQRHPGSI